MLSTGSSVLESVGTHGLTAAGAAAVLKLVEVWLSKRRRPEDLAAAVVAAAEAHMSGMREDFRVLRERLDHIDAAHRDCERRCDELTGELRQARQKIDSLTRHVNRTANAPRSPK
jgi:chromosome segregation ATPase